MIKRQKCPLARAAHLQSSLIKSPVNSSGTGLNIKILPLLTKFRTRSLKITNSRSCKHSIIGSRRVLVSQAVVCQWRHWFGDTLQLTGLLGSGLSQFPRYYSLCLANLPHTDYAPTVLILQGMMHHDCFLQTWDFCTWGYPKKSVSHKQYI